MFLEREPQQHGPICFQLRDCRGRVITGASIYAQPNGEEAHIRVHALGNFPNSGEICSFVESHSFGLIRSPDNPSHAYRLRAAQLRSLLAIIAVDR